MKIYGIFVMLLLFLTIVVVAQETTVEKVEVEIEEPEEAGVTPDSLFYGLDKAFERISLALTFDRAEKAEKRLKIASERIAELRVMIKKEKPEFTAKLVEEHDNEIEEAEKDIEKAKALGKNVTLLREHVAEMTYKHVIVLQEVLEKVPEQAKPAIEKSINKSIEGNKRAIEKIEKETGKPAKAPKVKAKVVEGEEVEEEEEEAPEEEEEEEEEQEGNETEEA